MKFNQMIYIRRICRNIVLPVSLIKNILETEVFFDSIKLDTIVDFGSGSFFWTDWLKTKGYKTYAVDEIYEKDGCIDGILITNKIEKVIHGLSIGRDTNKSLFFACDVIHHLDEDYAEHLFSLITEQFKYVVIKDIDCNNLFGNEVNRIHDRLFNGEIVHDVDPNLIVCFLENRGYNCVIYSLKKLFYPHFMIIGKR